MFSSIARADDQPEDRILLHDAADQSDDQTDADAAQNAHAEFLEEDPAGLSPVNSPSSDTADDDR